MNDDYISDLRQFLSNETTEKNCNAKRDRFRICKEAQSIFEIRIQLGDV